MSRIGSAGRVVRVCTLLATIHSLLASRPAKDLVRMLTGRRYQDGLYRFAYNAQSAAFLAWVTRWFLRQPDRELHRVRSPWSWLMRAAQAASLVIIFSTVWASGTLSTRVPQLRNFLGGSILSPPRKHRGPARRRWRDGGGGTVPLLAPPEQPRGDNAVLALPPHDGESGDAGSVDGDLRRFGGASRGAPTTGEVWRGLREVPARGTIFGT